MVILGKQVLKQVIREVETKTEIMVIPNRYKDTFNDLIDSSDIKPLNMPRLVNKGLHNVMLSSENPSNRPKLDKNISDRS